MPNRRRRPLQDEGRKDRKDFRQRAEQSRIHRNRIEEHRERRERRREVQKSRRQQVDSVRSPKEDLRTERWVSRLLPVEDSFLARPIGTPSELPVFIGDRHSLAANQTFTTGVEATVFFDADQITTERNGYPAVYDQGNWRIPSGLSGIWMLVANLTWSASSASGVVRSVAWESGDGGTVYAYANFDGENQASQVTTITKLMEGDHLKVRALQDSGGNLDLLGGSGGHLSFGMAAFLGK